jgi:hypothetical protein
MDILDESLLVPQEEGLQIPAEAGEMPISEGEEEDLDDYTSDAEINVAVPVLP